MAFNSLMHERNIYKVRPDFAQIARDYPEFRKYALCDAKGKVRVDFTDPESLRVLTKILLKKDFNISVEIPRGFLIPTIPQRLNYILWVEDLLSILPEKNKIPHGIDIGCGPCAIFSILGAKKNGWMFTCTETSVEALQYANSNINSNDLGSLVKVINVSSDSTLREVLSSNQDASYDFCLCNPPFFESMEDIRKKRPKVKESLSTSVKDEEIFAKGGEVAFVKKIIEESQVFKDRVKLYTSMFGKKKSFVEILKVLQGVKDITFTKNQFCQGNTIRWGIAWTYVKSVNFELLEKPKSKKPKKAKPPLVHHIPKDIKCPSYNVQELSKIIWKTLKDLKILIKVVRVHEHYTESQVTTDDNTWSNQRRKRREAKKNDVNANLPTASPEHEPEKVDSVLSKSESTNPDPNRLGLHTSEEQTTAKTPTTLKTLENKDTVVIKIESEACSDNPNTISKKRKLSGDDSKSMKKFREAEDIKLDTSTINEPDTSGTKNEPDTSGTKNECSEKLDSPPNKRKLTDEFCSNSKKQKLDNYASDMFESKPISAHDSSSSVDSDISSDSEADDVAKLENNPDDDFDKDSTSKGSKVVLVKAEEISDLDFEPKSLLFCTMKIRRAKDFVLVEMQCPADANHESMHQIFQFLKNKLH